MANELDLRDLRYFEAIAELGHMGRAAKALFRTQPALTGCVRRLERTLGTALFTRAGRGIRLTAAGEALLFRARSLRIASQDAVREIGDLGKGLAGLVRVGTVPTVARYLLPPVCREIIRRAPGITLKTVIGHNDVLRNGLRSGELDVVVSFSAHHEEGMASHDILEDEVVVAASRNHPIFRKRVTLAAMLDYGWVLAGPGVATRDWIDHAFTTRGLQAPSVKIETNLILLLPPLIEQSNLLTFVSRRHIAAGRLREVPSKDTTMKRRFAVTYRKDSYISPASLRLVELLREEGAALFQSTEHVAPARKKSRPM
jgi:DNA-binding transcriptional LysR family regulator